MKRLLTCDRQKHPELLYFALFIFLFILVSACGDAIYSTSETGSIAFSVEWKGALTILTPNASIRASSLDCEDTGVSTVEAEIYDESGLYLTTGGPWLCSAHTGTIQDVPVGSDRTVVVLGKDINGDVLNRGEKSGITVTAGQTTDAGTIVVELFNPLFYPLVLITPIDGESVASGSFSFKWNPITGASEYQIQVSTDSNFTSTVIDKTVTTTYYTPTTTLSTGTYYWRVRAEDSYDNESAWSEVWSFTVSTEPGIVPSAPTAVIALAGDEGVTISWNSVSGATNYNIYWATWSGVSKNDYEGKIEDITSTSYTHTGLTNSTTYYYIVTAVNNYGESDESDEVDATISVDRVLAMTELLKGYWHFYYTIISTWDNYYTLDTITGDTNSQGGYYIYGTDEYGDSINACYWPDDEFWTLLDPGTIINRYYVLYTDGIEILENSCYYQINNSTGDWSSCSTLYGDKISSLSTVQVKGSVMEATESDEMRAIEGEEGTVDDSIKQKYWQLQQVIDSQK